MNIGQFRKPRNLAQAPASRPVGQERLPPVLMMRAANRHPAVPGFRHEDKHEAGPTCAGSVRDLRTNSRPTSLLRQHLDQIPHLLRH